ncbi:MAG: hypothetical protein V2G42_06915 [bacterium JZ-2024 1]
MGNWWDKNGGIRWNLKLGIASAIIAVIAGGGNTNRAEPPNGLFR